MVEELLLFFELNVVAVAETSEDDEGHGWQNDHELAVEVVRVVVCHDHRADGLPY